MDPKPQDEEVVELEQDEFNVDEEEGEWDDDALLEEYGL